MAVNGPIKHKCKQIFISIENSFFYYKVSDWLILTRVVHLSDQPKTRIACPVNGLKCEKLTDDGRWMPCDGKSSHCPWQGELIKIDLSFT
jgi:hypothetical protein